MKVYEPCKDPCEICKTAQVVFLPYVKKPDKDFPVMMGVCKECRDKVPYPVVPVTMEMDQGYYFFPDPPDIDPSKVRFREEASQEKLRIAGFVMGGLAMAASDGSWADPAEGGP